MNRGQRRTQEKEERRKNSKKNFVHMGKMRIPFDQIQQDKNLKECDSEVLNLLQHRFDWQKNGLIRNKLAICIITKGCDYLDSLCSLRFDITPIDDKTLIRDTMYYVGNFTNLFIGLITDDEYEAYNLYNKTIAENMQAHKDRKDMTFYAPITEDYYPQCNLPEKALIDDWYASFVAEHGQKLTSFLQHTRKSDIEGDETYLLEVLNMILKKTKELLPEAQVESKTFVTHI